MIAPDVTEVLLGEVPGDAGVPGDPGVPGEVPVEVLDGVPGDTGVRGDTCLQEGTAAAADGSALTLGNGGGRRLFCGTKEKELVIRINMKILIVCNEGWADKCTAKHLRYTPNHTLYICMCTCIQPKPALWPFNKQAKSPYWSGILVYILAYNTLLIEIRYVLMLFNFFSRWYKIPGNCHDSTNQVTQIISK